jgi:cell division protein FtsQ
MMRQSLRRYRAPMAAAVAVAALAAGGVGLARSETVVKAWPAFQQRLIAATAEAGFRVRAVEVEGRERANAQAILAALGVTHGTPIFAVDPAAAKLRLEQVPWVKTASIYRRLPDTLFVTMTEQEPLAFWQRRDHLVLIDRGGRPIATRDLGDYSRLPVLVGDDAPSNAEALLKMLVSEPKLAEQVAAAVRIGARRWNIQFKNGVAVALPEEDADGAWHRLATIEQNHRILERQVLMVDLRLPDRVYLKLQPDLMPKPPTKKKGHGGDPV